MKTRLDWLCEDLQAAVDRAPALHSVVVVRATLREVLDAYRNAGGRGPARLQIHLSWAATDDEAIAIAHDQWRNNIFTPPVPWDLETVEAFDLMSADVTPEKVRTVVNISSDLGWHRDRIAEYAAIGFDDDVIYQELAKPVERRLIPTNRMSLPEADAVFAEWREKADKIPY